ncbi:hypothetical protein [Parafrankia sp. EUN1f]|uniref:hypothetical protein n=1 Tax=Parafrankia sp. EUN1f TaxID=102897 RepID=UPI0012FA44D8|nr:hypothetical protein [Parafrankia sp. EUN1f]
MATKTPGRPGKVIYLAYQTAIAAAMRRSRAAGPLRVYECEHCAGWHLTHRVRPVGVRR